MLKPDDTAADGPVQLAAPVPEVPERGYNQVEPFAEARGGAVADGEQVTDADREAALLAMNELGLAMALRRTNLASSHVENIRRYTSETAADGGLAMSRSTFVGLASKGAIKTSLTTLPKTGLDHAVSTVIRHLTGQGLSIFGKALNGLMIGMLYDLVVELLFDPTGKKLRAAYRAGAKAGADAVAHAAQAALATVARDLGEDKLLLDELGRAIARAGSRGALFGLVEWMKLERAMLSIPVVDDSLYRGLIEAWVLQHAGDEGNKHTDPEAYAAAHRKLAPDGNLARRDLFVHQCRFAFARLGIDAERQLTAWEDAIHIGPEISEDELIQRLGPLGFEVDRFADPTRFVDAMAGIGGPFNLEMPLIADAGATRESLRAHGGPVEAALGPVADYTLKVEDCVRTAASGCAAPSSSRRPMAPCSSTRFAIGCGARGTRVTASLWIRRCLGSRHATGRTRLTDAETTPLARAGLGRVHVARPARR